MTDSIFRPEKGTVIEGVDKAIISCRKYTGSTKVRETSEHHAFQFSVKGNVRIRIERVYNID